MSMAIERHVRMPMRDGTLLSVDIYRPQGSKRCPVVLTRTCSTKAPGAPGGHADKSAF
jgi:predicted acyl esterase